MQQMTARPPTCSYLTLVVFIVYAPKTKYTLPVFLENAVCYPPESSSTVWKYADGSGATWTAPIRGYRSNNVTASVKTSLRTRYCPKNHAVSCSCENNLHHGCGAVFSWNGGENLRCSAEFARA